MDTQRRLLAFLRPHYATLAGGLLCAAVTAGITVGIGWFIQQAIDAMTEGRLDRVTVMCVVVMGAFRVKGIFSFGQSYLLAMTADRVATSLRDQIDSHLHSLSLSFFNKRRNVATLSSLA